MQLPSVIGHPSSGEVCFPNAKYGHADTAHVYKRDGDKYVYHGIKKFELLPDRKADLESGGGIRVNTKNSETHRWAGPVVCSICEHRHVAVIEISKEHEEPIVPMECRSCGNMTANPE